MQLPESLQTLAQDLDVAGPAVPLSDEDATRMIAAALEARHAKPALWRGGSARKGRVAAAGVLLLLGSSAAAAWYQHGIAVRERENARLEAPSVAVDRPRNAPQSGQATPAQVVPYQPVQAQPTDGRVAQEARADESPSVDIPARAVPAEDLLQKASRLRREGQPAEAEQTYLQLVQREPQSMSAYVARVAVAELRMGRNPASAIELLHTALRHFPNGPLEIEIHQALAQAYRGTGNALQERSELTRLITQHPGTPAADRAQVRLNELAGK
jgi:TolA-binding protein